jgi:hypothetical protein
MDRPEEHAVEYRGYRIQKKEDFGAASHRVDGFEVHHGFVVTDRTGSVNVMPGAAWFLTVRDAKLGIDDLITSRGSPVQFWKLVEARLMRTRPLADPAEPGADLVAEVSAQATRFNVHFKGGRRGDALGVGLAKARDVILAGLSILVDGDQVIVTTAQKTPEVREASTGREVVLDEEGCNRRDLPVLLWSHAMRATNRNHAVRLNPGKAMGTSLCKNAKQIRPRGDPVTTGILPYNPCRDCKAALRQAGRT